MSDISYTAPEIYKKDLINIEKTIGSVKELLIKQAEEKIKEYLKKNNIEEYNNESNYQSDQYGESSSG